MSSEKILIRCSELQYHQTKISISFLVVPPSHQIFVRAGMITRDRDHCTERRETEKA